MSLPEHIEEAVRDCLSGTPDNGSFFFDIAGLARGEVDYWNEDLERDDKDLDWIKPYPEMGIARSNEAMIYYYVADRELFFSALAEVHGQDAITEFLLNQEQG